MLSFIAILVSFALSQVLLQANDNTVGVAQQNSNALAQQIYASNNSDSTLLIPHGTYYLAGPIRIENVVNLKIELQAELIFLSYKSGYPYNNGYSDLMTFDNCDNIEIIGNNGKLDGSGYDWWFASISFAFGKKLIQSDDRPKLLNFQQSSNIVLTNLYLKNSPFWNLNLYDVANVTVTGLYVETDVQQQKQLHESFGSWIEGKIPLFPLNTDAGYDDAVAVKPLNPRSHFAQCSENMLIEDAKISFSVGMTIGSVPGGTNDNCVRNITFNNVYMENPFKAIYVKSNPGVGGHASISNIVYTNFMVKRAIWWPIYIGPQQQKQPDGGGPGCFLYPLQDCPTNQYVTMTSIMLKNIVMVDTIAPFAGAVRCNAANPCTNFDFENVHVSGGLSTLLGWKVENIQGTVQDVKPNLKF
ncbi:hypothetical protein HDV06_004695 [Boothiomyces sp. JEL0866]|nr:hypothetical protein HDV06_004695 [Boothiomyces sp. JEL0866]